MTARWYGEMTVPQEGHFLQHVKQAGVESEELVLLELADWLREEWQPGVRYVFGPGSTLHGLASQLGLQTTLLGVDVIEDGRVLARDVDAAQLLALVDGHAARLLVTAIGGQGHILGRGNQQISPQVVRAIGLDNLRVVATKRKLATLQGRPLLVDSGDPALDQAFPPRCGYGLVIARNCSTRWAGRVRLRLADQVTGVQAALLVSGFLPPPATFALVLVG